MGRELNAQRTPFNERKDLERDVNKTSREIYRAKHNNRRPQ